MKLKVTQEKGQELIDLLSGFECPIKITFESKSRKVEMDVAIVDVKINIPNEPRLASIDLDIVEVLNLQTTKLLK